MTVTLSFINRMYKDCLLRRSEKGEECITVPGMTCGAHTFHKERLEKHVVQIVCGLKKLPRIMRYSHSPDGVPWFIARRLKGMSLETAEALLVMGIAVGVVRVTGRKNKWCEVSYVVIDDKKTSRKERMKPEKLRRYGLINWK